MNWITSVWSMVAGVCLGLALLHFLVWLRSRESSANLVFAIAAIAAGGVALQEAALMRARTPAEYGEVLRWMHVSFAIVAIAMVWFIRLHLRVGRLWLAWLVTGLRVLNMAINFLTVPNAHFGQISGLGFVPWMGEMVAIPIGEPHPLRFLVNLAHVALLIYFVDAGVTAWRKRDRWHAVPFCVAVLAVGALSVAFSQLMVLQVLPGPLLGPTFLLIVLAMAIELSRTVTRERQISRELRDSQERMRLATSDANIGVWEWNIARNEVWVCDTIRDRIDPGGSGSIDFERVFRFVHGDDRQRVRKMLRDALESGSAFEAEYREITPDCATRWIAASGQVVRGDNGKPILIRGITCDITRRKADEAELLEQKLELERMQRASTIGQLGSSLAHELNQPLGAILRNAEAGELFLQHESPDHNELKSILGDIKRDEQRAAAVIDHMRAMLRREQPAKEPLSVRELLDQVLRFTHAECQARRVVPQFDCPDDLPLVLGDRVELQQVALNLILNALDAMACTPVDRRSLMVTARRTDEKTVEVAFNDMGQGLPAGQESQLFEPFFTTKAEGLGMGLAISRAIVAAHGGHMSAHNNPAGGATFTLALRVAAQPSVA